MGLVIDHLFQLPFPIQNMNECFSQMFTKRKDNCTIKNSMIFLLLFFLFEVCLFLFCVSTDLSTFNFGEAKPFGMMHEVPCISVVQWCFKWDERSYNKKDICTLIDINQVPEHDVVPGLDFFFFYLCGSLCLLVSPVFLVETDLGASLQSSAPQQ